MLRRAIASASRAAAPAQRRFASSAAPAENAAAKEASFMDKLPKHPDYQGAEAVVRYYLPHSGQISMAVFALYGLMIMYNVQSSKSSALKEAAAAPAPEYPAYEDIQEEAEVSGIPSIVEDPAAWVEFVSEESNIPKLVAAAEAL